MLFFQQLFGAQRSGSEPLVCGTPGRAGSDSHSQHSAARGFVEIQAAAAGTYRLRIRPYDDKEPSGRYAVRIVGIDAQENEDARRMLGPFLEKAYGERRTFLRTGH